MKIDGCINHNADISKKIMKENSMDLIDRQAAIELAMQYCPDDDGSCSKADRDIRELLDDLENLPAAQPERLKGRWIERNPQNSDKCRLIECDKCGFSHIVGFNVPYEHWIENRNFCERCGADMRGENDDIPDDIPMEYFENGGI